MSEWSVEVTPNAVATQVVAGLFKLPVIIYLDYRLVAQCELTLSADQIEPLWVRGLVAANGSASDGTQPWPGVRGLGDE